jgi:hypothetical protein
MSGLLGSVYSFGDSLKRKVRGLLSDPLAQIQLNMNQAAGGFNDAMRSPATEYARAGGVMADDPSTQAAIRAEADRRIGALMNVMPGGLLGATVWHGSPHRFAKFDASKIGTGEGAQAYGHGLYLAEAPEVAASYQKALSSGKVTPPTAANAAEKDILDVAAYRAQQLGGDLTQGLQYMERNTADSKRVALIRQLMMRTQKDGGNLYKVDLPDPMIARMLDWDKPLSQQPAVLKALEKHPVMGKESPGWKGAPAGQWERAMSSPSRTGEWLYRELGDNSAAQTEAARAAGIPGIRYLDGGSRGSGSGTSNYVVFPGEEGLLTILERNGVSLR